MSTLTESYASEIGHWYTPSGAPAYTVIGHNGKERPATLRDARKLGLVPSVTTIMALEAAPGLVKWKIDQALLSAMTLPRLMGEDSDSFMKRCLEDSKAQAKKAAERGTHLHGLLEHTVAKWSTFPVVVANTPEDVAIIEPCIMWLKTNFSGYTWKPERSFACDAGYGGKLDLCGESATDTVVIDYKFKTDIIEGKRLAYDNHATQLAAYAYGLEKPRSRCINLFISSTTPGLIVPHEWSPADVDTGYEVFSHLLAIWKLRRGL